MVEIPDAPPPRDALSPGSRPHGRRSSAMADSPTPTVLLGLQRAVLVRSLAERTDGELLDLRPDRAGPAPAPAWESALDDAISRLPAKYRVPLLLCELEGRSRAEAARHLGIPEGTLSSRLARARDLLRRRLVRGGVAVG